MKFIMTDAYFKSLNWRPMTQRDLYAFLGCESVMPLICDDDGMGGFAILDGDHLEVYSDYGIEPDYMGTVKRDAKNGFRFLEEML